MAVIYNKNSMEIEHYEDFDDFGITTFNQFGEEENFFGFSKDEMTELVSTLTQALNKIG